MVRDGNLPKAQQLLAAIETIVCLLRCKSCVMLPRVVMLGKGTVRLKFVHL